LSHVWRSVRSWLFPVWCVGCGEPEIGLCAACAGLAEPVRLPFEDLMIHAAGDYAGPLREAILAVKRGERACLEPLAALLAPLVPAGTALVPVTTSRGRAARRGFDQARELAERVARLRSGWTADVLRKRGGPQRGLGRMERLAASGRFALRRGAELPSAAVIIDDVVTTGATLLDAAETLEDAGCRVIGAVVLARTQAGRETSGGAGRLVQA
jgi:predicted amidophosphoribosyltransferase